MRSSKYQPLTDYLQNSNRATCYLTFAEIEYLLGFKLPQSAFEYPVFWMNTNQTTCRHWLKAGYIVIQYSLEKQYAVFQRNEESAKYYYSKIPSKRINAHSKVNHKSPNYRTVHTPMPAVSCESLMAASEKYMTAIRKDPHARYLSWEHCYSYFQCHRRNPSDEKIDFMCLHLAWYLASWGMLRGGSFLLWKDYKVHRPVIQLLLSPRYAELNGCSAEILCDTASISKIIELSDKIVSIYWDATSKSGEGRTASDTLVTKILLGTLGCTPAYDRYFKSGLNLSNVANQSFGKRSLMQLASYYVEHKEKLETFRHNISQDRVEYTPMKVIDMCFWQIGYDADPNRAEEEYG